jgi:FG-GAP-like repeat/FG-GAP repeat
MTRTRWPGVALLLVTGWGCTLVLGIDGDYHALGSSGPPCSGVLGLPGPPVVPMVSLTPSVKYPDAVGVGDMNGDGKLDLVVANRDSSNVSVRFGNGDGTFAPAVEYSVDNHEPTALTLADLNGDGKLDLVTVNGGNPSAVSVLLNTGEGALAPAVDYATGMGAAAVVVGDLDGDGKPDLAVASSTGVSVLRNTGKGAFAPAVDYATGMGASAVVIGDFDRDGKPDLAVANSMSDHVAVLFNTGGGAFANPAVNCVFPMGSAPQWLAIGDLDGDGWLDLAVASNGASNVSVLVNDRSGSRSGCITGAASYVTYDVTPPPESLTMRDLDGDGKPDLAFVNGGNSTVSVLLNAGDGTFPPAPVSYLTDSGGGAQRLAIGDLDGDKSPDLTVLSVVNGDVSVLLNAGDGTFVAPVHYVTLANRASVAAGDLDGDGKPDLVFANPGSNDVSVLLSNGDGTFQGAVDFPAGGAFTGPGAAPLVAVAVGDLDGDGTLDLAVVNTGSDTVSVLLNTGEAPMFSGYVEYSLGMGIAPCSVAMGDFNRDGLLDLAVANHGSHDVSVLLNQGHGTFTAAVSYGSVTTPNAIAVGDLDGDGWPDLVVADATLGSQNLSVLRNSRDGTFPTSYLVSVGTAQSSVVVGDLNGDGNLDLAITGFGSQDVRVLLNNGDGTFAGPPAIYFNPLDPISVTLADLNGDGWPDLIAGQLAGVSSTISVLLNTGNGSFSAAGDYLAEPAAFSLAAADFDGDGRPDLVVAGHSGPAVSVLLSRCLP